MDRAHALMQEPLNCRFAQEHREVISHDVLVASGCLNGSFIKRDQLLGIGLAIVVAKLSNLEPVRPIDLAQAIGERFDAWWPVPITTPFVDDIAKILGMLLDFLVPTTIAVAMSAVVATTLMTRWIMVLGGLAALMTFAVLIVCATAFRHATTCAAGAPRTTAGGPCRVLSHEVDLSFRRLQVIKCGFKLWVALKAFKPCNCHGDVGAGSLGYAPVPNQIECVRKVAGCDPVASGGKQILRGDKSWIWWCNGCTAGSSCSSAASSSSSGGVWVGALGSQCGNFCLALRSIGVMLAPGVDVCLRLQDASWCHRVVSYVEYASTESRRELRKFLCTE